MLFSIYAGLFAARNLPIASLLLTFAVAPLLATNLRRAQPEGGSGVSKLLARFNSLGERMAESEMRFRGHIVPVLTVVILLWIVAHHGRLGQRQLVHAQFSQKRFPVSAVDLLAGKQVRSQVFAPDSWGGYLIYRLYPPFQVFVDDRHDFYGEKFLQDYIKVTDIQSGWQEVLDSNRVNWVLIQQNSALSSALKEVPSWKLAYADDTAALFTRTAPLK
jgi:hypothetical protein